VLVNPLSIVSVRVVKLAQPFPFQKIGTFPIQKFEAFEKDRNVSIGLGRDLHAIKQITHTIDASRVFATYLSHTLLATELTKPL